MENIVITIFTPTYNRAYILHKLYKSLLTQTSYCFEWLIIDDGSKDTTEVLVNKWISETNQFKIRYYKTLNGGKPRAINKAVELAKTPYLFIVDSDDYLVNDVMFFLSQKINKIKGDDSIAAIGVLRGRNKDESFKKVNYKEEYIDAHNLEREKYGLNFDCNEVYKIEILKKNGFKVLDGELFSPEEIVFNEIALQGYKVRWFNRVGVISEYLNDGMTLNSFELIKNNPMGFAMSFNHQLKYKKTFFQKFKAAYLFVCYTLLGRKISYLQKSNDIIITILAFPVGLVVAFRRLYQYKKLRT